MASQERERAGPEYRCDFLRHHTRMHHCLTHMCLGSVALDLLLTRCAVHPTPIMGVLLKGNGPLLLNHAFWRPQIFVVLCNPHAQFLSCSLDPCNVPGPARIRSHLIHGLTDQLPSRVREAPLVDVGLKRRKVNAHRAGVRDGRRRWRRLLLLLLLVGDDA